MEPSLSLLGAPCGSQHHWLMAQAALEDNSTAHNELTSVSTRMSNMSREVGEMLMLLSRQNLQAPVLLPGLVTLEAGRSTVR